MAGPGGPARGAPAAAHHPRKRFGQHFLADTSVVDAIVRAIAPLPGDAMVEIGPGLGALTRPLLDRLQRLVAVELDRDLAHRLHQIPRLQVVQGDALALDFTALAQQWGAGRLRVVGNLPYNISSPILFHLLAHVDRVQDQHFMLQQEVVDRMAAQPATSDYGRLSVMLQWRYAIEPLFGVPPQAFDPPPRVHSAVVRMTPLPQPPAVSLPRLTALVRQAFSQRRKLLRHSLEPWLAQQGYRGDFDLRRRAEEVPVHEYLALAADLPSSPRLP